MIDFKTGWVLSILGIGFYIFGLMWWGKVLLDEEERGNPPPEKKD